MAFDIDFLESYDLDSIAAEMRRIAELLGKQTVSRRDIDRYGRLNSRTVMQKFGTMRKAHEAAGLTPARFTKSTNEELLGILVDLWTITLEQSGRSPSMSEVGKFGFTVSARTIASRFGSWKKALVAASTAAPDGVKVVELRPVPAPRAPISVRKRFFVFKRDLYQCQICRDTGVALVVDHVVPVNMGGSDRLDNLQTLCVPCNLGKGGSLQ
jgi:5-methylcytosine-specific restriction enzyme A